jgi:hypothetical protein
MSCVGAAVDCIQTDVNTGIDLVADGDRIPNRRKAGLNDYRNIAD